MPRGGQWYGSNVSDWPGNVCVAGYSLRGSLRRLSAWRNV